MLNIGGNILNLKSQNGKLNSNLISTKNIKSNGTIILPIGSISIYPTINPPKNYLRCDGSVFDINKYPELASVIGTTYGGTPSNPLLPNLSEKVIVGSGAGPLLTNRVIGATGGEKDVLLTQEHIPEHTHSIGNSGDHKHTGSQPRSFLCCGTTANHHTNISGNGVTTAAPSDSADTSKAGGNTAEGLHSHTTDGGGGKNQRHNNMMPYYSLNYIIRAL